MSVFEKEPKVNLNYSLENCTSAIFYLFIYVFKPSSGWKEIRLTKDNHDAIVD